VEAFNAASRQQGLGLVLGVVSLGRLYLAVIIQCPEGTFLLHYVSWTCLVAAKLAPRKNWAENKRAAGVEAALRASGRQLAPDGPRVTLKGNLTHTLVHPLEAIALLLDSDKAQQLVAEVRACRCPQALPSVQRS